MQMEPDQPDYHYFAANMYFKLKNYAAAIENYTSALSLQGNDDVHINIGNGYYKWGVSYLMMKEHEKAATDFSKVIAFNESFAQAYHNRGVAYKNVGRMEKACSDFRKALELGNSGSSRYLNRHCSGDY